MKKTNSPLVFGAFVVACLAAVRCGGSSDTNSTPGGTSGSSGNAGTNIGAGGANNGGTNIGASGANNGGANNGGANNGGANNGGANNGGGGANNGGGGIRADGGAGTQVGAGGTQVAGDAGMCPAAAPMDAATCTGNVTCDYPGAGTNGSTRACACLASGARNDAGMRTREWNCFNMPAPRDAGAGNGDGGGTCPNNAQDGNMCMTELQVCRTARGGTTCVCIAVGNNLEWACN